jgi:hypothetical protein
MGIPVGVNYTATLKGHVWRAVTCQQCACQFAHFVEFYAEGHGMSMLWLDNEGAQIRAKTAAARLLPKRQHLAVGCVPCPNCGHFQPAMERAEKGRILKEIPLRFFGLFVLAIVPVLAVNWLSEQIGIGVEVGGYVLLGAAAFLLIHDVWAVITAPRLPESWHPRKAYSSEYPVLLRDEFETISTLLTEEGKPPLPVLEWPELRTRFKTHQGAGRRQA